jgi:hypothetical protein
VANAARQRRIRCAMVKSSIQNALARLARYVASDGLNRTSGFPCSLFHDCCIHFVNTVFKFSAMRCIDVYHFPTATFGGKKSGYLLKNINTRLDNACANFLSQIQIIRQGFQSCDADNDSFAFQTCFTNLGCVYTGSLRPERQNR